MGEGGGKRDERGTTSTTPPIITSTTHLLLFCFPDSKVTAGPPAAVPRVRWAWLGRAWPKWPPAPSWLLLQGPARVRAAVAFPSFFAGCLGLRYVRFRLDNRPGSSRRPLPLRWGLSSSTSCPAFASWLWFPRLLPPPGGFPHPLPPSFSSVPVALWHFPCWGPPGFRLHRASVWSSLTTSPHPLPCVGFSVHFHPRGGSL